VGTIPKSSTKIIERGKNRYPLTLTHKYMTANFFCFIQALQLIVAGLR